MMRSLSIQVEKWPLKQPFIISRLEPMLHGEVVVVEIEQDGVVGRGECERSDVFEPDYPPVVEAIEKARSAIEQGATTDTQRSGIRKIRHERQLGKQVASGLRRSGITEQDRLDRHTVNGIAG
mgnify:CR=1 FL=1